MLAEELGAFVKAEVEKAREEGFRQGQIEGRMEGYEEAIRRVTEWRLHYSREESKVFTFMGATSLSWKVASTIANAYDQCRHCLVRGLRPLEAETPATPS